MLTHREYKRRVLATKLARERAAELRDRLTEPEVMLWSVLKGNRLDGHAFRTQHAIGGYIADFYCHRARLVVEIDGEQHQGERLRHDARRDEWMRSCGIEVLRVRASDVFENLEGVRRTIAARAKQRIIEISRRS